MAVQTSALLTHCADGAHPVFVDDLVLVRKLRVLRDGSSSAVAASEAR